MVKIPIIVLNWNGLEDTVECIDSLLAMKDFPYEIILVDNGSIPEEKKKILSLYKNHNQITLISNKENLGFTKGNSIIVEKILSQEKFPEFIALLNNDTVVAPDWISTIVQSAIDHQADIVSSRMINYYDRRKIDNVGHFMLNTGEILPLGHNEPKEKYTEVFENMGACGGAALYNTSMIREIGFFDPYFDTGYEDAEIGVRAKLLGYKCICEPKAVVYHKVSRSIVKIMNDEYLQNVQINIFYTYAKLMPTTFIRANTFFIFVKYTTWFIIGLFAFRFKLLNLHSSTLYRFFMYDLKSALISRKAFYNNYGDQVRYKTRLLSPTKFFLFTDVKRAMTKLKLR